MLRAVLFDLDDTLFDHRHCARSALESIRGLHDGLRSVDAAHLERTHAEILEVLHLDVLAGRLDLDSARVERFRRLYTVHGIEAEPQLAARTAVAYRQGYIAARREVAGASVLLAEIRRQARVVIVSNNLLFEQQEKLRHCGLDQYVDVLVVSEEAGASKPDPEIFRVALDRAGCAADETVMVGDSWPNDVEGARAVGIAVVWFNPDGATPPDPDVPVLRSLEPTATAVQTIYRAVAPRR